MIRALSYLLFTGMAAAAVRPLSPTVEFEPNRGQDYGSNVAVVAATAPGLFAMGGSGQGQAAALNQDGSINSAANPAARGDMIVLYGTGAGLTNSPNGDGAIAAGPSQIVAPVTVSIDGKSARVLYAGSAPTLVEGVIQVNAVVPADAPTGPQAVELTVGLATSQPYIYVSVK